MNRREIMAGLWATLLCRDWTPAAHAQSSPVPVVGFLNFGVPTQDPRAPNGFLQGLAAAGFVEGKNVKIESRWAKNNFQSLPELAADLLRSQAAVIVALGAPATVMAAKAATSTVPIVFVTIVDPVNYGFVSSFNRPDGNITGVSLLGSELIGKRLNLLFELVPKANTVGYLSADASSPIFEDLRSKTEAAAQKLRAEMVLMQVRRDADFEIAFKNFSQRQVGVLLVGDFTSFIDLRHRQMVIDLATRYKIPAMYGSRLYPAFGGLMSYEANFESVWHLVGNQYVARILKGTKPAELSVQQPTKFDLVINLKAAKAIGLEVPPMLLALVDEVIE
jgi:putative tryptophan/tyrosine transport system substrate-binding protein